jgi:hypothetical protein
MTKSKYLHKLLILDTYSVMLVDANDCTMVEMIDYIIINSYDDVKMKNAITYLDTLSKLKGISIYQIIYDLCQKDVIEDKIIRWTKPYLQ